MGFAAGFDAGYRNVRSAREDFVRWRDDREARRVDKTLAEEEEQRGLQASRDSVPQQSPAQATGLQDALGTGPAQMSPVAPIEAPELSRLDTAKRRMELYRKSGRSGLVDRQQLRLDALEQREFENSMSERQADNTDALTGLRGDIVDLQKAAAPGDRALTAAQTLRYGALTTVANKQADALVKDGEYTTAQINRLNQQIALTGHQIDDIKKFDVAQNQVSNYMAQEGADITELPNQDFWKKLPANTQQTLANSMFGLHKLETDFAKYAMQESMNKAGSLEDRVKVMSDDDRVTKGFAYDLVPVKDKDGKDTDEFKLFNDNEINGDRTEVTSGSREEIDTWLSKRIKGADVAAAYTLNTRAAAQKVFTDTMLELRKANADESDIVAKALEAVAGFLPEGWDKGKSLSERMEVVRRLTLGQQLREPDRGSKKPQGLTTSPEDERVATQQGALLTPGY